MHTSTQMLIFNITGGLLYRNLAPLACRSHITTLSWNQAPVQMTIKHRITPPTKLLTAHALLSQPRLPRSPRLTHILINSPTNLIIGITRSNRHPQATPSSCNPSTHNQPDKEGFSWKLNPKAVLGAPHRR